MNPFVIRLYRCWPLKAYIDLVSKSISHFYRCDIEHYTFLGVYDELLSILCKPRKTVVYCRKKRCLIKIGACPGKQQHDRGWRSFRKTIKPRLQCLDLQIPMGLSLERQLIVSNILNRLKI